LFAQLWHGKFKNEKNILSRYTEANDKYKRILTGLYFKDLDRLKNIEGSGRNLIESYEDCMKRVTEKKMLRQYRFVAHPLREQQTIIRTL
jgi:hypothetical protein